MCLRAMAILLGLVLEVAAGAEVLQKTHGAASEAGASRVSVRSAWAIYLRSQAQQGGGRQQVILKGLK